MKLCGGKYGCGQLKKYSEFYYSKINKSYNTYCKACQKIYMKNNKEYEEYVKKSLENLEETNGLKRANLKSKKEFLNYKKGTSKLLEKLVGKKQGKKPKDGLKEALDWYKQDAKKMQEKRELLKSEKPKENKYEKLLKSIEVLTDKVHRIEIELQRNLNKTSDTTTKKQRYRIKNIILRIFYTLSQKSFKICNSCGKVKRINKFWKKKDSADGIECQCIKCRKEIKLLNLKKKLG